MEGSGPTADPEVDGALAERLDALIEEGLDIWHQFDSEVRQRNFHPFVPADYRSVLRTLRTLRAPGLKFLEWGSATGVITIMADLLGFEAYGIELDAELVGVARDLAARHGSAAKFVAGSFVPAGYRWKSSTGDTRLGTIGDGASAYPRLGRPLEEFDLVYAYPWTGEAPMMQDLMRSYGRPGARLLLHGGNEGVKILQIGRSAS